VLLAAALVMPGLSAQAPVNELRPGDVFRDYTWRPSGNAWQRVTGPDATYAEAKKFLPNPVNSIQIADVQGAKRIVAVVEKLTSHAGTNRPRMRVNGNAWIDIPEPATNLVPGAWGSGGLAREYLMLRYPWVELPVNQIKQGTNTFEFTCQGQGGTDIGKLWPQWLLYGVTFRVFFDANKPHPTGKITSPPPSAELGSNPTFTADASSTVGVDRVEFIGNYDDFSWRGDGAYDKWQVHPLAGVWTHHIGNDKTAPYARTWDTTWIPTQPKPFSVIAVIFDKNGMAYVPPAVTGLTLRRNKTVIRYRSFKIPKKWQTRTGNSYHACEATITEDVSQADAARLFLTTWNGLDARGIGINSSQLVSSIGGNHNLAYNVIDFDPKLLKKGPNALWTRSTVSTHGIEVEWPGIELFVRYKTPESRAFFVPFGTGCKGSNGTPTISALGTPALGNVLWLILSNAPPTAPVLLATGFRRDQWLTWKLPLDMAVFKAPGCWLYTSPDLSSVALSDARGIASLGWPVPNLPQLIGISFYTQWMVYDPPANGAYVTFSGAARATIGDH